MTLPTTQNRAVNEGAFGLPFFWSLVTGCWVPVTRGILVRIWAMLLRRTVAVAVSAVTLSSPSSWALELDAAARACVCHSCLTADALARSMPE